MNSFPTPSQKIVILIVLFFVSLFLFLNNSHPFIGCKTEQVVTKQDSIVPWKFPELSSISDNEEGKLIRLGRDIFLETYMYLGPYAKDSSKRYLKTDMDCQNCHFNAGTQQNVFGLVGVYSKYPALDARTDKVISIEDRINGCMTRSMNGRPVPEKDNEMKALVAYLKWLSTYVPKGKYVVGQGVPKIKLLDRAANVVNGRNVYTDNCMNCHGEDGSGALVKPGNVKVPSNYLRGYDTPPVMGAASYNDGAGLYRLLEATAFIYAKMPLNKDNLSLEKAYDVAAYINSLPRPDFPNVGSDYPNLKLKPLDFPFPPYDDTFSTEQHRYGPYEAMLKEGETNKEIDPNIGDN